MRVYSTLAEVCMSYFVFGRVPLLSQPLLKKLKCDKTMAPLMNWQNVYVCVYYVVCDLCISVPIKLHIFVLVNLCHILIPVWSVYWVARRLHCGLMQIRKIHVSLFTFDHKPESTSKCLTPQHSILPALNCDNIQVPRRVYRMLLMVRCWP